MVLTYPVSNPFVSQKFAEDNTHHPLRRSFYSVFGNKHPGIDFSVNEGENIFATYPGIVVRKEFHKGMGNVIGIRNGNIIFLYAHLSLSNVELGQTVTQKELIGVTGNTGNATTNEPHLHFEMRDISKKLLKDMVFEPKFNSPLMNFKDVFTYRVNNTNTIKTMFFLSERYFGIPDYWTRIADYNLLLERTPDKTIPDGTEVIIPNYY